MIVIQGEKPASLEFDKVIGATNGSSPPLVFDAPAIFDCYYSFASFSPVNLINPSALVANDLKRLRGA